MIAAVDQEMTRPSRRLIWSILVAVAPLATRRILAQDARVPVWWIGASAAIGNSRIWNGNAADIYHATIQGTRRVEFGLRLRPRVGLGVEWSRSVGILHGQCTLLESDPNCRPSLAYRAVTATVRYGFSPGTAVSGSIGGYRLAANRRQPSRNVAGIDARAEHAIVGGAGSGLSVGLRGALIAATPGYWIGHVSVEATARLWWLGGPRR